ncbi:hypothetical protein [Marinitenerispora sediminis]|uniref:Uncharacterized protein n=1 Tax=Marinitenerispora sediminis TaxID=1931232 RepID=A0A368T4C2_9ACTN|nr:hypothetical protein [Marinitenerispora sediminis]RCV49704.1 hypothetical protein DEF28_20095 [Marinitenerispora sediminis]RCV53342.1 hypothetical protein DEF23_17685 [Marinitenerispora sediminis]RCV57556.1 hypothetical protein DEF24_15005 [Marinitenerispora sediminis]
MSGFDLPAPDDLVALRQWAYMIDAVPPQDYAPVLDMLHQWFGDRYIIRRTHALWWATDRDPRTSTEPTIIEPALQQFVMKLLAPSPRAARPNAAS